MGELQHGIYDDDWDDDLTYEEINMLHGFSENGDVIDEDEYDQVDGDLDDLEDSNSDVNYMESDPEDIGWAKSCAGDMRVCSAYPELILYTDFMP